jgi:hypothetical protein
MKKTTKKTTNEKDEKKVPEPVLPGTKEKEVNMGEKNGENTEEGPGPLEPNSQGGSDEKGAEKKPEKSSREKMAELSKQIEESIKKDSESITEEKEPEEEKKPDPVRVVEKKKPRRKRGRPRKKEPVQLVTGENLLFFIDVIIPRLIAETVKAVSGKRVAAANIQLTEDEKRELVAVADQVAAKLSLEGGDPVTLLSISLISIYGIKTLTEI